MWSKALLIERLAGQDGGDNEVFSLGSALPVEVI